ncbi:MAG: guanylate kinase [bacterium]|nr:guanylate kinase [bacterium]
MTALSPRPGLLITMVGPAGAGKNQLINDMIARFAGRSPRVRQFPTATTRPIREGEQDGREHHFVTVDAFQKMIEHGELLEWQLVHGKGSNRYYGMPRHTLESGLAQGDVLMADIEYLGAQRVKEQYPHNVIGVFVMPPSIGALIERMKNRATESTDEIGKRLLRVPAELDYAAQCDYVIVNDSFAEAASLLYGIIGAEVTRRNRQKTLDSTLAGRFQYKVRLGAVDAQSDDQNVLHEMPLADSTPPFDGALALARAHLAADFPADRLITGRQKDGDDYIPPVSLDYTSENGHEVVTFVYQYRRINQGETE